jgi:hypothetical protein
MMRSYLVKTFVLLFVVLVASGCTGGGSGTTVAPALSTSSSEDSTTTLFSITGNELDNSSGTSNEFVALEVPSGEGVARVHNPEPASMILFGLGALGLLRRKKIAAKQQNLKEKGGVK